MSAALVALILQYKYPLIIVITIVEGPLIMLASGFFIKLGYLPILPTFAALMVGDLIGDAWWYAVGYYFGQPFVKKFGKYFSVTEDKIETVKKVFHKHHNRILIISKLTMGFGFALVTLITAGLVKIPFRKYMALNIIGQFFWTGFLVFIGYTFGHLYTVVNSVFGQISVIAGLIIIFFLIVGLGKYIKTNLTKSNQL